jgi:hypothetical protein
MQSGAAGPAGVFAYRDQDMPALGELDRVADEVRQDLPQPHRVAHDTAGASGATSMMSSMPF